MRFLPVIILTIAIGVLGFIMLNKKDNEIKSHLIGTPVPTFELNSVYSDKKLNDTTFTQNGWKVLNVFASWCGECLREHKYISKLSKTVPVYGIAYKDKTSDTKSWLNEHGNPYTQIGIDIDGKASILFGVYAIPQTFLIDENGIIRFHFTGGINQKIIDDYIMTFIKGK